MPGQGNGRLNRHSYNAWTLKQKDDTPFADPDDASPEAGPQGGRPRTSDPDYLETFARGIQVLLAMGDGGGSIAELARATSLPRPTVRRVLYTLNKLGYAREDGRHFVLTPKVTRIANAFLGTAGQSRMLQSVCQMLSAEIGEIVTVAILDNDEQLHVAFGVPPNFVGIALGVGSRLPSYLTAAGRVMWSRRSDAEIDAFLARVTPVARTEHTITDKSKIREAIFRARLDGYCVADAEYSTEFKGVACPVVARDGTVFGALTINARKVPSLTPDRFDGLVQRCRMEAQHLAKDISH